ncbi:hypothetical protein GOP47_0026843 [Adiantum capillus-veneris]|nr:hypothetical protein GOP47_0026843 [Adiantum capillus-veneris]
MAWSRRVLVMMMMSSLMVAYAASSTATRPDPNDAHLMARWLVASSSWAVISTTSLHLKGAAWGNVADVSDGAPTNSSGVPYFYLTMLDPTPQDLQANPKCSVTFSEHPFGTCGNLDAEDPRCAKLSLYGEMNLLQENSSDFVFGKQSLFSKHPQMKDWPSQHKFNVYRLNIEDIFLIDYFGGPKKLNVSEYFKVV